MSDGCGSVADVRSIRAGRRALWGGLPFGALAVVWTLLVHVAHVPPQFLPPLERMPGALWEMFSEEGFFGDILISCARVLLGFFFAVVLATPLGVWMGYSRRASRIFEPILGFIRYMPVPVFIPICILWFGSGDTEKMVIIFLGGFFQLVLMVRDAASAVKLEYYEAATMLGAPRRDLILRVLWQAAKPQILNCYRICIGWAWTYLVVAEIVGATNGVGYYIIKAQRYLLVPKIFAAMALIGVLGMVTDILFAAAHKVLFPWQEDSEVSRAQ
jgi:NitT/TauT family transport system permease protein